MGFALVTIVALTILHYISVQAQPNPADQDFLAAHNRARAEVGVVPLRWSQTLATEATRLANVGCRVATLRTPYGLNQYWATGALANPGAAVDSWMEEKKYYNHGNNSCAPGRDCRMYTQVVWRKTVELGCGQATCEREGGSGLIICLYNPPGNVAGESPY